MVEIKPKNVAVIVAHPDDETLWAGGTILSHPSWNCFIVSVCRRNDFERASKFYKALKVLKSGGNDWQTWSASMYLYAAKCVEEKRTPLFDEMRKQ
jgi:pentatricopeptide repeat protein